MIRRWGARPLARLIDTLIKSPLSRQVLFGDLVSGGKVAVTVADGELKLDIQKKELEHIKETIDEITADQT